MTNMRNFIIFLFFFTFFNLSLKAEIVSKLSIKGNERVSTETIKIYGDIEIGKNYSESDLDTILKKLYDTEFFESVDVNITNQILTVQVKEYPIINQLIIVGEKSNKYKDQLKKIIKLKEKKSFIKSYLANDVKTIKSLYSSLGYSFAEVNTKIKKIDDNKYDSTYRDRSWRKD